MTEPELIAALNAASVDARAVITMLTQYANSAGDVTLMLSNGQSYTLPGIQKQANGFAADRVADQIAYAQDFGGANKIAMTYAADKLSTATATFSTGHTLTHTYNYLPSGDLNQIAFAVRNPLNAIVASGTRTCVYSGSQLTSIT